MKLGRVFIIILLVFFLCLGAFGDNEKDKSQTTSETSDKPNKTDKPDEPNKPELKVTYPEIPDQPVVKIKPQSNTFGTGNTSVGTNLNDNNSRKKTEQINGLPKIKVKKYNYHQDSEYMKQQLRDAIENKKKAIEVDNSLTKEEKEKKLKKLNEKVEKLKQDQ